MESYFDLNKKLMHKGTSINDGTLLTNFNGKELIRYSDAIIQSKMEKILIVSPFAYNMAGEHLPNHCSLHILKRQDLSPFWRVFDILKETNP